MNNSNGRGHNHIRRFLSIAAFPVVVLIIYITIFIIFPEKALISLKTSGNILLNMLLPLSLVFILMLLLNIFLKPAGIVKFLGTRSGIKGILLSIAAGIISTGPIYAWYPLLKDLRNKGAGISLIAIFLYNRAVKPFLLPIMISYFGWLYVLTLTILTISASVINGYLMRICIKDISSYSSQSTEK